MEMEHEELTGRSSVLPLRFTEGSAQGSSKASMRTLSESSFVAVRPLSRDSSASARTNSALDQFPGFLGS